MVMHTANETKTLLVNCSHYRIEVKLRKKLIGEKFNPRKKLKLNDLSSIDVFVSK